MKNKKWKVKFSDEALNKLDDLPDNAYEELTKIIQGLKNGKIDPTKLGKKVNWVELDKKLICPKCKSEEVQWLLDKNSDEVDFHCLKCSESFWMTNKEYKMAVKRNPDKIVKYL